MSTTAPPSVPGSTGSLERPTEAARPAPRRRQEALVAYTVLLVPPVGVVGAVALQHFQRVSWLDLALFAGMYLLTMLGITAGFHRHATHRAFQAHPAVRTALLVLGAMAAQGPIIYWSAEHRRHHRHSDQAGDPHSPHVGPHGEQGGLRGFWHAHLGWMTRPAGPANWHRLVPDLLRDPLVVRLDRAYPRWVALGLVLPAAVGGLATGSLAGALSGFVWGGLVRLFAVHHATWSVNSVCHTLGRRAHDTADRSTNHLLTAWLTLGEGWHNNHHAQQASARHGWRWWQLDLTWLAIRMLAAVGLASQVILPARGAREDA